MLYLEHYKEFNIEEKDTQAFDNCVTVVNQKWIDMSDEQKQKFRQIAQDYDGVILSD